MTAEEQLVMRYLADPMPWGKVQRIFERMDTQLNRDLTAMLSEAGPDDGDAQTIDRWYEQNRASIDALQDQLEKETGVRHERLYVEVMSKIMHLKANEYRDYSQGSLGDKVGVLMEDFLEKVSEHEFRKQK